MGLKYTWLVYFAWLGSLAGLFGAHLLLRASFARLVGVAFGLLVASNDWLSHA